MSREFSRTDKVCPLCGAMMYDVPLRRPMCDSCRGTKDREIMRKWNQEKKTRESQREPSRCEGCEYWGAVTKTCDFLLIMFRRRECPVGDECTEYVARTTKRRELAPTDSYYEGDGGYGYWW